MLDITFIGDKYGENQAKFHADVDSIVAGLLAMEPYKSRASQIVFRRFENRTVSLESKHSASMNRLVTCNSATVFKTLNDASVPYDKVIVLVNDGTYGGSGGIVAVACNGSQMTGVALHEYNHTMGLVDEYLLYSTNGANADEFFAQIWKGIAAPVGAGINWVKGGYRPNYWRQKIVKTDGTTTDSLMRALGYRHLNEKSKAIVNARFDIYAGPML